MKYSTLYVLLFLTSFLGFAQESDTSSSRSIKDFIDLGGYIKEMQTTNIGKGYINTDNLIHNRLNFRFYITKEITLGLESRNRIIWGETIKSVPDYASQFDVDNGSVDLTFNIVEDENWLLNSTIDRVWAQWLKGDWSVRVGRQRINWGINNFWNSNDIFNAYNFTDFDYEERPGSDAIKVEKYFNGMNSIQFAVSPGKDSDSHVGGVLYKFNTHGYDIQALAGWYRKDVVLGGGWAGNIKNAGFKGEATYYHPSEKFDSLGVFSTSISTEIMFGSGYYTTWGILFNSNGVTTLNPSDANLFNFQLSSKELMPTRYNALTSHTITLSPLSTLSIIAMYSPSGHFTLFMPTYGYSIAQSWDLNIVVQSSFADISGYRNLGNAVFVRLKWSF